MYHLVPHNWVQSNSAANSNANAVAEADAGTTTPDHPAHTRYPTVSGSSHFPLHPGTVHQTYTDSTT